MTCPTPFRSATLCIIFLVAAASGCWNAPPPGRVTVYGVVKVNGQPVPDGTIGFESVEDGVGGGGAKIGPGGKYQVFLWPSTYRIGVISVEGGLTPAGLDAVEKSKIRVPAKYALPSSSGIEVKVDAKNCRINLDLTP
jgi:hypothetical protein